MFFPVKIYRRSFQNIFIPLLALLPLAVSTIGRFVTPQNTL